MSADSRIGTELSGYRIEQVLGRGGMSIVYLAEHLRLHRKVALKLLSPQLSTDEGFRTRFIRESETAASLDHPNIIPIFEAGEVDGVLFIAMRYVKTTDLLTLLGLHGKLDPDRAIRIIEQTAGALDAAHAKGLIHRDVKPANILVAEGEGPGGVDHVYLSDFGITRRIGDGTGPTGTGIVMGTLNYLAPEQIRGQHLDGRTDQYGLACVLFKCLTRQVPFERDDEAAVLYAHLSEPPPRASAIRPDLPPGIDQVIVRAMAKSPGERYPTCGEFAFAARATSGIGQAPPRGAPAMEVIPADGTPTAPLAPSTAPLAAATAPLVPTAELSTRELPVRPAPSPPSSRRARRLRTVLLIALVGLAAAALTIVLVELLAEPEATGPSAEGSATETGATGPATGSLPEPLGPRVLGGIWVWTRGGYELGPKLIRIAGGRFVATGPQDPDPVNGTVECVQGSCGLQPLQGGQPGGESAGISVRNETLRTSEACAPDCIYTWYRRAIPATATASATAPPSTDAQGNPVTYEAANLVDGRMDTAWRVEGPGEGETVTLRLEGPTHLTRVGLVPGYSKIDPSSGVDRFTENRRIRAVVWAFDDGTSVTQRVLPRATFVWRQVDVETSTITLTIIRTTVPGGRDYAAISEIALLG